MANIWEQMSAEKQAQALENLAMQNLAAQQSQIGAMAQQPVQTDLSPLMQLTDQWTGSNIAPGYQAPREVEKRIREMNVMQGGLTEDTINMLRGKLKADATTRAATNKALNANTLLKVNEGNVIPTVLSDIALIVEKNESLFNPVSGSFRSRNPWDQEAQVVRAQLQSASQMFGKYMEGGVLRKEDEEKYKRMFPQLGDKPSVAKSKLQTVRRLLSQKQKADVDLLKTQGFDVTGLEKISSIPRLAGNEMSGQDKEAYQWATANPADPRSAQILQKLGM